MGMTVAENSNADRLWLRHLPAGVGVRHLSAGVGLRQRSIDVLRHRSAGVGVQQHFGGV